MPKIAESVVMACTRAQDNMIKTAIETKATEVGNVIEHNNTGWTLAKVKNCTDNLVEITSLTLAQVVTSYSRLL